jgi:hypothetical protein
MTGEINVCRRVAPEDLRPGLFVAVLSVVHEVYPPSAFEEPELRPPRPVRVVCMGCADGEPLRVVSVCVPFVQLEDARGELRTLDIRREQLGVLADDYGLEAFTRPGKREES